MSSELHLVKEENEILGNSPIKCEINISIDKSQLDVQVQKNCELF